MSMRRKQLGGLISSLFFRNGRWLYKVWACAEKNTGLIDQFVLDCQKVQYKWNIIAWNAFENVDTEWSRWFDNKTRGERLICNKMNAKQTSYQRKSSIWRLCSHFVWDEDRKGERMNDANDNAHFRRGIYSQKCIPY